MSDFAPQTTDVRAGDTRPHHSNVILKGSVLISTASQTKGFSGSATIKLPINTTTSLLKPEALIYNWNLGSSVFYNYPAPFTEIATDGTVAKNAMLRFKPGSASLNYTLEIWLFDAVTTQTNVKVYYRVLSVAP